MKPARFEPIDVRDLRIGMYVQMPGGWMSHPFAVSSFRIDNAGQIETIRGLGVAQVRWAPELSDEPDDAPAIAAKASAPAPETTVAAPPPAETAERIARRERAAAEREALRRCERQYNEAARDFHNTWALIDSEPEQAREHTEKLTGAIVEKMVGTAEPCIRLLSDTSGERVSMHALNVALMSLMLGRHLGLPDSDLQDLGVGALLHDVGKIGMPERLRHRGPNPSPEALRGYEEHVARGVVTAKKMALSPAATLVVAQHHEHVDGSGFPQHLRGERMTALARIVAIVDRYDRLCNPAVGVPACTPHEALSQLFAKAATQFDTTVLYAFIKLMGVYPPGSTVQLTDDRYAMVVDVDATRSRKPKVRVHEPDGHAAESPLVDLELEPHLGIRRGVSLDHLPEAARHFLAPRQRVAVYFDSTAEAVAPRKVPAHA